MGTSQERNKQKQHVSTNDTFKMNSKQFFFLGTNILQFEQARRNTQIC